MSTVEAPPETAPPPGAGSPSEAPDETQAKPRFRWLWLLVAALLAGALGIGLWFAFGHRAHDESVLELQGNIDVRQVNLSFKVDGRIESLAVDEGDSIQAGQVLATLDNRYFEDDLRLARARRDTAAANLARLEHGSRPEEIAQAKALTAQREATLVRAKQDFQRAEQMLGSRAIAREDFDLRRAALEEAQAQLKSAQEAQRLTELGPRQEDIDAARAQLAEQKASIVQLERRLADATLLAPNPGIILTRAREKGAIVQAGETVFALTLASPVWVRTYVNERDLGRVEPNMTAYVQTDSAPDKFYPAKVGFISPTAEFTPKTVETRELRTDLVYRLRIIVDNPDGGLRQGMPVTVRLDLRSP